MLAPRAPVVAVDKAPVGWVVAEITLADAVNIAVDKNACVGLV